MATQAFSASVRPFSAPRGWAVCSTGYRRALPLLLGIAVSCSGKTSVAAPGPLAVTDDAGQLVRLIGPPQRIVSLNPSITELLFAIGAGSRLSGRTRWCDWPPAATRVPSVGEGFPPNVEAVLARHPDLAIAYPASVNAAALRRLRELGVPVLALRTDRIEDLARAARRLGAITGLRRAGDSVGAAIESELAATRAAASGGSGLRVVLLAWEAPPLVLGRGSYLHEVLELTGSRNAFGEIQRASAPVSLEAIAARDPDVILAAGPAPAALLARPEWQAVSAVRHGRVLPLSDPALMRPSPRALAAVSSLRAQLARITSSSSLEISR